MNGSGFDTKLSGFDTWPGKCLHSETSAPRNGVVNLADDLPNPLKRLTGKRKARCCMPHGGGWEIIMVHALTKTGWMCSMKVSP